MKYETFFVKGYWLDDKVMREVLVSTSVWDGVIDGEDDSIFFYTYGEPLFAGKVIGGDFVICSFESTMTVA